MRSFKSSKASKQMLLVSLIVSLTTACATIPPSQKAVRATWNEVCYTDEQLATVSRAEKERNAARNKAAGYSCADGANNR